MAFEIERKFLVKTGAWTPRGPGVPLLQGYLSSAKGRIVRVRLAGHAGFLTIKGVVRGVERLEFEYPIPEADAAVMLDRLCQRPLIEKTRYKETVDAHVWEIDIFHGDNDGLVLAEIELARAEEPFTRPSWAGVEVSADARYFNSNLAANPFKNWQFCAA
jgi:adenylate cyclase